MGEISKYKLTFPIQKVDLADSYPYDFIKEEDGKAVILKPSQIRITSNQLTFTIGHIKCRTHAVVYFKFYGYDYRKNLITTHTSDRWIITDYYSMQEETFELTFNEGYKLDDLDNYYMEIYTLGIDSENPLYFNHMQLNEGEHKDYHIPNEEIQNVNIGFYKNSYLNLYDNSDTFLQIIRPNHEGLSTEQLTPSQMTILAPHLPDESKWDDPVALFYEFMYMTEQRIGVEK